MAGIGTISVNQTPQYGDKTALDNAAKAVTTTPMTGNPTPAPSAGRPVSTGAGLTQFPNQPQAAPQATPQEQDFTVPQDHQSMMDNVAQAYRTNQYWQNVLQQYPSDWTRMYAQEAADTYAQAVAHARSNTPFFE